MIWWTEFKNYLLESFTDRINLFGNFLYYTKIGLILAFSYCNNPDDLTGVEGYFRLFKYVSFAQTAFGIVNNCSRLNQPKLYLKSIAAKNDLKVSAVVRNVFLVTFTSGLFRIFITFWFSIMVYPIVRLGKNSCTFIFS